MSQFTKFVPLMIRECIQQLCIKVLKSASSEKKGPGCASCMRKVLVRYLAMVVTRSMRVNGFASESSKQVVTKKSSPSASFSTKPKNTTKAKQGLKSRLPKQHHSSATSSKYGDHTSDKVLLLSLSDDVVHGVLRNRPSKRNRSPYVADVFLEKEQREAIVHVPNLDMGGKCIPGTTILMKPARDKKGNLVGKDAINPKFGTPKCEFIAQLLRVDESDLGYEPTWVGAHPSLGEKIAEQLVERNLLGPNFPKVKSYKREVSSIGGADMRADFLIQHESESLLPRILEVKTVVDTDYSASAVPDRVKCVFTSDQIPYRRSAIFPWGQSNQKGPNGEKVVSARAIKHVQELTRLVSTKQYDATVLFVVIRHDAKCFRPNHEACPSFARYLKEAEEAGVQILAKQVCWGEGEDMGNCFEGPLLDIVWVNK